MAVHAINVWLHYDGDWHGHVDPDVDDGPGPFYAEALKVSRGYAEEGEIKPAEIALTWNDTDGTYRPTNPEGALYGKLTYGTRCLVAADGQYMAIGESASFKPDQTPDFDEATGRGRRWVAYTAGGILRRVGQWTDALRSTMYREISAYDDLVGHWPLEDARGVTQLSNTYPGGRPGTLSGVTMGADGPHGSAGAAEMPSGAAMSGRFATASTTAGWQIGFSAKLDAMPPDSTFRNLFTWRTSNGYTWRLQVANNGYKIHVTDAEGDDLETDSFAFGTGVLPTSWVYYRIKASVSGSTVTVEPAYFQQDDPVVWGWTSTFTGSVGRLVDWSAPSNASNVDALYAHVFGVTGTARDLQSWEALQAFDAYNGERATDRFGRLCNEAGIFWTRLGDSEDGILMGPQRPERFITLIEECARTDDAMLYDRRDVVGIVYRTRVHRYNQAPALELTFPDDIAPPLREIIDDLDVANHVTVSNASGGEATAVLESGPLSVQAPPDGINTIKAEVDVNVADETRLPELAAYWLARKTVPGPRYGAVTIDFDRNFDLHTAGREVDVGDRITITGRAPDPIDLLVIGIDAHVQRHRSTRTFTCVPFSPFLVGVWGSDVTPTTSRYDSRTSALAEDLTTSETIWDTTAETLADCWSTTAEPFDLMVGGERVTCTNATTPTGTGPYLQTLTCTRSVNGVVKTHATGTPIRLADPVRYALKGDR
ncbi:MAG TPA: hypothetical protein VD864_13840 [Nocardioides sp.]|nr:hypothetical protein [Nocardioides sp.]